MGYRQRDAGGLTPRGFFGIGVENHKTDTNIGTLWRSAHAFGAAFLFTIGRKYKHQPADTTKAMRSVPVFQFETFESFHTSLPLECVLIGVEFPKDKAVKLQDLSHPACCIYLLGNEDTGLSQTALKACHHFVSIPSAFCLNVSVAGSIVMYDRVSKGRNSE